ncbi:MAG: DinB family protein [Chloroflexota bacterium]
MHTPEQRAAYLDTIRNFPGAFADLVNGLTDEQLTARALDGEWTIAQNIHHVADSHINSYVRLKLILTEERPPLKGYDQEAWAKLVDGDTPNIEVSLNLLRSLHTRWVAIFESLTEEQWQRVGIHSEIGELTPDDLVKIYADHCDAHIDQVTRTLAAQG